jgi:hypothetical protein
MLLKAAAAPVRRRVERLKDATLDELRAAGAGRARTGPLKSGELPMGYRVLNPVTVEAVGGELAQFVQDDDKVRYAVRVPDHLARRIKAPKTTEDRSLVESLPPGFAAAVAAGERLVPLEPAKTVVLHYKKDDHEVWAKPILYPLLDDLQMLQKLKLADRSALDGAISHIRLWRLGNLEYQILPTPEAIQRLADMLLHNVGGGVMDLIWGPELDLVETSTEIHRFLGNEKYLPTLASIFGGLGIPPTLTGTMADAGLTNNFVSMRVMMERLEYCREVLTEFWLGELAIVQEVFGFRQPFKLAYAVPNLSDDSAEKKLLVDLIDRDVVSPEFVQERFGADPEIEQARLRRNMRQRKDGSVPPKAGPFHVDSQQQAQLQRAFVGTGELTPSEVGVDLKPRKPGEVPPAQRQAARKQAQTALKKPAPKTGRPKGATDSAKRKTKRAAPKQRARAAYVVAFRRAHAAAGRIDELARGPFRKAAGKAAGEPLSAAEARRYRRVCLRVLCALGGEAEVSAESVKAALATGAKLPPAVGLLHDELARRFEAEQGRAPSAEEARRLAATAYALDRFDGPDAPAV